MIKGRSYSVLVTGASSGIGLAIAENLASLGHQVFAGVRKAEDAERIRGKSHSLVPILIDVTSPDSIKKAYEEFCLARKHDFAVALINNAGVEGSGPIEVLDSAEVREVFDVNFFGTTEVTRAFLGLLRETKGRVVNISSLSAQMGNPFNSSYCASKAALEAWTDSLRREVIRFGVQIIIIRPGAVNTPMWTKALNRRRSLRAESKMGTLAIYSKALEKFDQHMKRYLDEEVPMKAILDRVEEALQDSRAKEKVIAASRKNRILALWCRCISTRTLDDYLVNKYYFD